LSDWASPDPAISGRYTQYVWLGVYIGLVVFEGIMTFLRGIISVYWSRNASNRLHKDILAKIVRATTTFFDITPMGRLLTRISKDIGLVDQMLASQFVREEPFIPFLFSLCNEMMVDSLHLRILT
jgi:ABC-type multidrug transport system fused ATPase/permease subunit